MTTQTTIQEKIKIASHVARTILDQLGGNRFVVMTGAKNLMMEPNGMSFTLPSKFATNKANFVKIELTVMDDYIVSFYHNKCRSRFTVGCELISRHDGIYCDTLQGLFTRETGLHTHL